MAERRAYSDGPLTRDHVWPECFLARAGRTAATSLTIAESHGAFNSARARGSDHEYLRHGRSYILTGQPRPAQLTVTLEMVSQAWLPISRPAPSGLCSQARSTMRSR